MANRPNLLAEFVLFIKQNKSYYLIPIIVVAVLFIALILFSLFTGGAAAPFIYTLF